MEVPKNIFVLVERQAGFRNTMGEPLEPATSSFSAVKAGIELRGISRYMNEDAEPKLPDIT